MRMYIVFIFFTLLVAQSQNAALTIYKDGTVLIKQPIKQTFKKGINEIFWDKIPASIHHDTPFLNFSDVSVLSQSYNNRLFSSIDYFESQKGKKGKK